MTGVWVALAFALFGAKHIVEGVAARATGFHKLGWSAGYFMKGKQVPWWVQLGSGVVALTAAAVCAFIAYPREASRDFDLSLPPGFTDLSGPVLYQNAPSLGISADEIVERTKAAAAVGAAVDDDRVSYIEVRLMDGPWEASMARLKEAADRMSPAAPSGEQVLVGGHEILDVSGVQSGRFRVTAKNAERTLQSLIYVLPARGSRAYLAYSADVRDYEKHLPAFMTLVERARLTRPSPMLPFPPFYLMVGAVILEALATWATAKPIPESVPLEAPLRSDPAAARRPRKRRRVQKSDKVSTRAKAGEEDD